MPKRKLTKRKGKKSSKKIHLVKGIIDVPIDTNISEGSKASKGNIDYHYRKYYNTFTFLKAILKKNKQVRKLVCIPKVGSDWMKSALQVHLMKSVNNPNVVPLDSNVTISSFIKEVKRCLSKARFVPISIVIVVSYKGTHANMVFIDTHKKTIELFEPHGYRPDKSNLEDISKGYFKVYKFIKKFFTQHLPNFTFIRPSEYEPMDGLQGKVDAYSGLCVTWSILYVHYRLLNPNVSPKTLIKYLDKRITRNFLLRYTRYIEKLLKHT